MSAVDHPHPPTISGMTGGSLFGPNNRCFACAPDHPSGLRMQFSVENPVTETAELAGTALRGTAVVSSFVPGELHQGASNMMHGGLLTTFADELAVWTIVLLRGHFGFTGTMNSRFLRPIRLGVPLLGRGSITRNLARLVDVEIAVTQSEELAFTSKMTFVLPDRAGAEKMMNAPLPEEWQRYFR
jgi:acyl-coenzyme A thioesterase PaaI-like protein